MDQIPDECGRGRLIGRSIGGWSQSCMPSATAEGRPLDLFVTAGQISDYVGARALVGRLPKVEWLLGDPSYDAARYRKSNVQRLCLVCVPR